MYILYEENELIFIFMEVNSFYTTQFNKNTLKKKKKIKHNI